MQRNCSENTTTGTSRNDPNSLRFCDYFGDSGLSFQGINIKSLGVVPSPPWHNESKLHGAIPIKWGFVGSIALTNLRLQASNFTPSNQNTSADYNNGYLSRQWTITSTTVYPTDCKCPLAGQRVDPGMGSAFGQSSILINLVPPGKVLTPRLNQVDFGIRRVFRFRDKYRLEPEVQFFNLFNSNAVITQSESVPASARNYSIAAFLPGGIGGPVTVYTPPRLMRLALQLHF